MKPHSISRRNFLAGCAACAASASCPALAAAASGAAQAASTPAEKTRLKLVFTHIPPEKATWPYQGYDYEGRKRELTARLVNSCPNVDFLPVTVLNRKEAETILQDGEPVDGYLVYMVGIWSGAPQAIADSGRPTLFVDDLYAGSGEFLIAYAAARRKGLKVAGVSSSRFEDVVQGVKAFECLKRLRSAVILDVTERDPSARAAAIEETFGTKVHKISAAEINYAYSQAAGSEAQQMARRWVREAKKVVEPSREEIQRSAAMYLAMRGLMMQYGSPALTIDCLNLFYDGKLPAYPCLGLFQFNNDGLVGACEADLHSTITMLLMTYLVGRPGYISDPVIDTSRNQIIYAHCVAPNKVFGPSGPSNPYHIRDHSEDRKGAAVRSLLPLGEITTTLLFHPLRKQVIIHQARTVANIDEDKACRTKLAAEVRDAGKLLSEWDRFGWHRVTYYGDFKAAVETVSTLAGFQVVEEG